ncbi:MAG: DUF6776 family protein [Burkholderiales bacterium]
MRWKLFRRRLSISAPPMIVRSRLPWPLRSLAIALVLGFSAALALWAFEFGREIAGLDRGARQEIAKLRAQLDVLSANHAQAQALANSADSLLKAERAAQERLATQVKTLEAQNADLTRDLGFFEKLLPTKSAGQGLTIRGVQAEVRAPGRLHYQLLIMQAQAARGAAEFHGRYELSLAGTLDGRPWNWAAPGGVKSVSLKQYQRLEGAIDYPSTAVVRQLTVRLVDAAGTTMATETARL